MWNKVSRFIKAPQKVVVIGIDGVPYTLIRRFIQDGTMPNLAEIVAEGTLVPMDSSLPEVSSVAWTSFMTGVNPGKHGIYGFMELKPGTYKMCFPNSQDIKTPTLWDILGEQEKRSVVINLPSTYPAREIKGVLSAGFVALDLKKATYPESAYSYLESIDYKIDVDSGKARDSLDCLVEDLNITLQKREQALRHFFDNEKWDLFIGVITETDRLHHFLWDAIEEESHRYHGFFREFYGRLDRLIGSLYERCCDDHQTSFMLVSDHGFTRVEQEIYLNNWLKENGYLKFSQDHPQSLEDMANGSRAFALDPSRIYINLQGKYPKGSVTSGTEYERLRDELIEQFAKWEVISQAYKKEDIYSGPYLDNAPDIILLPQEGYDLKGSIKKKSLMGKDIFTGMHTHSNALFFVDKKGLIPNKVNIVDVAPTILHLMGESSPVVMDGKIISD